jgi:hypothetical protein
MAYQRIPNKDIEEMFMNASMIARETGWSPNMVAKRMKELGYRGVMVGGRPCWYTEDFKTALKYLEDQKKLYPMAPSILPVSPPQA